MANGITIPVRVSMDNASVSQASSKLQGVVGNKIAGNANNAAAGFMAMSGAIAGVGAAATAAGAALSKMIADGYANAKSIETITTQYEVLLGSAESAAIRLEEVRKLGAETPFELTGLAKANITLEKFSQGALGSIEDLRKLGDAVALTGELTDENLVRGAEALAKAYSNIRVGKTAGESLQTLMEMGIITPKVTQQVEKLQKVGKNDEAWKVIQREVDKANGTMAKMAKTAQGLESTLKDAYAALTTALVTGGIDDDSIGTPFVYAKEAIVAMIGEVEKIGQSDFVIQISQWISRVLMLADALIYLGKTGFKAFTTIQEVSKNAVLGFLTFNPQDAIKKNEKVIKDFIETTLSEFKAMEGRLGKGAKFTEMGTEEVRRFIAEQKRIQKVIDDSRKRTKAREDAAAEADRQETDAENRRIKRREELNKLADTTIEKWTRVNALFKKETKIDGEFDRKAKSVGFLRENLEAYVEALQNYEAQEIEINQLFKNRPEELEKQTRILGELKGELRRTFEDKKQEAYNDELEQTRDLMDDIRKSNQDLSKSLARMVSDSEFLNKQLVVEPLSPINAQEEMGSNDDKFTSQKQDAERIQSLNNKTTNNFIANLQKELKANDTFAKQMTRERFAQLEEKFQLEQDYADRLIELKESEADKLNEIEKANNDAIKKLNDSQNITAEQRSARITEIETMRRGQELAIANSHELAIANVEKQYQQLRVEQQQDFTERMKALDKERLDSILIASQGSLQNSMDFMSSISKLMERNGREGLARDKKLRYAYKAASIAEATVATYLAATKALASAPPPFNAILAGTTVAAGLANVAVISQQKFAKGGFPQGSNANVIMNERGQEAILNASATKRLGRDTINKLNRGGDLSMPQNSSTNVYVTYSPTITASESKDFNSMLQSHSKDITRLVIEQMDRGVK